MLFCDKIGQHRVAPCKGFFTVLIFSVVFFCLFCFLQALATFPLPVIPPTAWWRRPLGLHALSQQTEIARTPSSCRLSAHQLSSLPSFSTTLLVFLPLFSLVLHHLCSAMFSLAAIVSSILQKHVINFIIIIIGYISVFHLSNHWSFIMCMQHYTQKTFWS